MTDKISDKKVTIIGLGLIGGSIARALRERIGVKDITAVNNDMKAIEEALRDETIAHGFCELNEHAMAADIIFICTPVKNTFEYLDALSGKVKPGCIVTDVCSTKGEIIRHVNSMKNPPCFIGGHPMAGAEKTGYSAGFSHLFENAYYILTPCISTSETATEIMSQVIAGMGAIPIIMDADRHDKIVGNISHLPHIIASALVNTIRKLDEEDGMMQMLAAGGFKDITRIASSSPEIWESIVMSNRSNILAALDEFINTLIESKEYIEKNAKEKIFDFFSFARDYRDAIPSDRIGLISPSNIIMVDVVDKPGIIGEIAVLLGENCINIKNINVSNSREFEYGCLKITFSDNESTKAAFELLRDAGFRVFRNA